MTENTQQPQENKVVREFGMTTWAVNNRTTVFFITFIILVMGLLAYITMPKESFPEVSMPTIYVGTPHPGNSPEDMENLITRPIEKELKSISGVDKITSNSVQDYSTIIVEFQSDVAVVKALQEVKDAVDKAKKELPSDLERDPNVFELNFSEFPIMNINLSGEYSYRQLKEYAEYLEDEIEKLQEISKVDIKGLPEEEVKINVDLFKLQSLELSFSDIENAIKGENVTISGGNLLTDGFRRSVRVKGEFTDVEEIGEIIIKDEKQLTVYLKDVADIIFDFKERESYARLEGKTVVMLDVVKRSGQNLLAASEKINAIVEKAKKTTLPSDLSITITLDQTINTKNSVADLENSIISGVILVVLVLLFFLGSRNSLFVGVAIPMSMFMSFMILGALGISINMMVLFGLIMALGMLVDNGIVVVENIYRLMDEGYSPIKAAKEGVGEVAWPIISSTATTLAAFLPLAFWPGIMGEFMKFLPITLIIVLGSSLFVALVINPALTAVFMRSSVSTDQTKKGGLFALIVVFIGVALVILGQSQEIVPLTVIGNLTAFVGILILLNSYVLTPVSNAFQTKFLPKVERAYEKTLHFSLRKRNPIILFVLTWILLYGAIVLFQVAKPKVLFFPENEPNYVNIYIEMPLGTDIEVTNEFVKQVETKLDKIIQPYRKVVNAVIAQVGEGTSDPGDPTTAGGSSATPHKGRISVEFVEYILRDGINTTDVMNEIRKGLGKYAGVKVTVDKNENGPPSGKPINIEISGDDFDVLILLSNQVIKRIEDENIPGIEELKSDLETGKPELIIDVDRKKARRLGISSATIAMELRTALFGKEVSKYKQGEDDYPIQIRLDDKYRYNIQSLMNQYITYRNQTTGKIHQVPISAIASYRYSSTYEGIKRKNTDRVVTVFSNILDGYNGNDVNNKLKEILTDSEFPMPEGYMLKFTGEQENMEKEMTFLVGALMTAVFLILLIIVAQFNKVSAPAIIMSSVVLSTIGVFLGLVAFSMEFVIMMTMIGIISLAGIVVNNAIVLIDYTLLVIKRRKIELGIPEDERVSKEVLVDAIIQSGKTRLRPVLLTAITTVLGLIPLAIGLNIDFFGLFTSYSPNVYMGGENVIFWGPMSWTIIFGITFATFLTLILVPVMFLGVERLKYKIYKNKINA